MRPPMPIPRHRGGPARAFDNRGVRSATARCTDAGTPAGPRPAPRPWRRMRAPDREPTQWPRPSRSGPGSPAPPSRSITVPGKPSGRGGKVDIIRCASIEPGTLLVMVSPGKRRRAGQPTESSTSQHPPEGLGVADGVAMTVVVEVGEDLAPLRRPLPAAVGPPPHVVVGVGPGVKVMVIRAVQPHVDELTRAGPARFDRHSSMRTPPGRPRGLPP
jgi:hypothetical protein